jgi:hypothetical protein
MRSPFEDKANHARYDMTDIFGMDAPTFWVPCDEEFCASSGECNPPGQDQVSRVSAASDSG